MTVSGIDWAPKTNRLVTCSHDRNAFVWTEDKGQWKPEQVILRINFSATGCKWSPDETKIATTSGDSQIALSYFNKEQNWWATANCKRNINGTTSDVAWTPDSKVIAVCCTDRRVLLLTAYLKDVDTAKDCFNPFSDKPIDKAKPGNLLYESKCNGWALKCTFNDAGDVCAYVAHDSSVSFIKGVKGVITEFRVLGNTLPYKDLLFVKPNTVMCVGYDYIPDLYEYDGNKIESLKYKGRAEEKKQTGGAAPKSAAEMFTSMSSKGSATALEGAAELPSTHKNVVNTISWLKKGTEVSTSGLDGNFVIWKS